MARSLYAENDLVSANSKAYAYSQREGIQGGYTKSQIISGLRTGFALAS
jgi:hypothetical protein